LVKLVRSPTCTARAQRARRSGKDNNARRALTTLAGMPELDGRKTPRSVAQRALAPTVRKISRRLMQIKQRDEIPHKTLSTSTLERF